MEPIKVNSLGEMMMAAIKIPFKIGDVYELPMFPLNNMNPTLYKAVLIKLDDRREKAYFAFMYPDEKHSYVRVPYINIPSKPSVLSGKDMKAYVGIMKKHVWNADKTG